MRPFSSVDLQNRFGDAMYLASLVTTGEAALWLHRTQDGKRLAVLAPTDHAWLSLFSGEAQSALDGRSLVFCTTDDANARALRGALPNLKPAPLGLATSAGCGDRLGLATPGHVCAFQAVARKSGAQPIAPIFAQQSIREMTRSGRTPDDVMRDATWGAFEGGWRESVGADADHLKTAADIDACLSAGFTFFTIDPGEHVDNTAETASLSDLREAADRLPPDLRPRAANLLGKSFDVEGHAIRFDEHTLLKAAVKYGQAVSSGTVRICVTSRK